MRETSFVLVGFLASRRLIFRQGQSCLGCSKTSRHFLRAGGGKQQDKSLPNFHVFWKTAYELSI